MEISGAKFCREYEREEDFNHLVRMLASLPFAPSDQLDRVFALLALKAGAIKVEKLKIFSIELVKYVNNQWLHGMFIKQDWNMYDLNTMMVPATNNGNEGSNSKFARMQIYIGCNYLTFLQCAFSNVTSNHLPYRKHSHNRCICLA